MKVAGDVPTKMNVPIWISLCVLNITAPHSISRWRRIQMQRNNDGQFPNLPYTEDEYREIMDEAPESIQTATKELREMYVSLSLTEKKLDDHPKRFFVFLNSAEEEITADLKNITVRGYVLRKKGNTEDVRSALRQKEKYITPLLSEIRERRARYAEFYKQEMKSSVTPELMGYIVKLFGEMNGIDDVKQILKEERRITMTEKELQSLFAKKKAEIEAKRATFIASSNQYRIATEAGRLQILNSILISLDNRYRNYMEDGKEDKALIFAKEIRNMLEQARKEVKGNELKLTVDGRIDITATLHGEENINRVFRTLPVNMMILGLVAAKTGMDPLVLSHQLATSYYKDFNGFNKNILGRDKVQLPGDLIRSANWGELEEKNKAFLEEMQPYRIEEATYVEDNLKQQVKDKLKKLRSRND